MTNTILMLLVAAAGLCLPLTAKALPDKGKPDTSYWDVKQTSGLFFSQNSYSQHFKGGGISSVALGGTYQMNAAYHKDNRQWANRISVRYGAVRMATMPVQKNDDHFEFDSKYGSQINKSLKLTALLNFQTRIHDTYAIGKDGSRGKRIGNFMAPAYLNLGSGLDLVTQDKALSVFYSPVNSKVTIVSDQTLVSQFLPPENHSTGMRYELGSLLRVEIKKELMTNISLHSISTFFTNHLKSFGAFDVSLENKLNFKINKLFSVNLLTQLIYDDDVLFEISRPSGEGFETYQGPRTQFREVLNIGLSHSF